jgi:hypothetical protein
MTAPRALLLLAGALSVAATQFASFTPTGDEDLTYSIHVPQDTATTGAGPIYIQLNATKQLTWFALGQGTSMVGANMFVVYTSGNNVTISPRLGKGEIQPLYNEHAKITTIDGTGIHGGVITANFRCDSCISWDGGRLYPNDSQSTWIWAVKYGKPLNSNSLSATVNEHDSNGQAIVNLERAAGTSTGNPFVDLASSPAGNTMDMGPQIDYEAFDRKRKAHAVLMTIAFVVLFPFFALALHLPSGSVFIHASMQLFTLTVTIAGMGLGISMAKDIQLNLSRYHPVIGIVTVAGLTLFQPAMGLAQHRHFRKSGKKGPFAYLHRWFGRIMIVLGIINVGLGFRITGIGISGAPRPAVVAYGVVAGVIGLVYIMVVSLAGIRRRRIPVD